MTDAAMAALEAAFDILDLDCVEAVAQVDNLASFAIMRRLGMALAGERAVWASTRNRDEPYLCFEIARDTFKPRGTQ